ncbi:hypothetical protein [Yersinia ruckeri]|uniref:hypothetical protein n=1 Tax=Yersinia ruckeri TaxID=29486 RepID=UPI00223736F0|nr:hypothetical protein [Yersinia ruckeri]MCW6598638.1 hypothetical protein [Yersinia ruckeri]
MINVSSNPQPVIRPIETEIKAKLQTMTLAEAQKADKKGYSMVLMSNYISEAYRDKYLTPAEIQDVKI